MAKVFSVKNKEGMHHFTVNSIIELREKTDFYVVLKTVVPRFQLTHDSYPVSLELKITKEMAKEILDEMSKM